MAIDYTKTKTGNYNVVQLASEINASADIAASCLSVSGTGQTLIVEMFAALSTVEETALDAIILAHILPPRVIDASTLKFNTALGGKLNVHSSSKPEIEGSETFAMWAGCGDDYEPPVGGTLIADGGALWQKPAEETIGQGPLLTFNMNYSVGGANVVSRDVRFDPRHGRVWIHEAYIKFENGGAPDCITSDIMAPGTVMQTFVDLHCEIDVDGWVLPAAGGPGTGTHGFAASPSLIERAYSKDGEWDYDGVNLLPNINSTGQYRININDSPAHRYINRVPLYGTSSTYFAMTSDETAELPVAYGYYIRINVYNNSNSAWNLSSLMEIYRERTVDP